MDAPTYSARKAAELLEVPLQTLNGALKRDAYGPEDIWVLREKLNRLPPPLNGRKQLFLNFKGGTGKTSLSTSYAYRMAELGYGVLLIDLDSQGHATKCLGYE